jgi:hypothetical protein
VTRRRAQAQVRERDPLEQARARGAITSSSPAPCRRS